MTTSHGAAPAPGPGDEDLQSTDAARVEAVRDARLASDAERELVCEVLNGAFGEGRLTAAELDDRTSRALAARTHGDLDDVLVGLAGPGAAMPWATRPERGILPRLMFWVVGILTSPFVFVGSMFLLFGSDGGDRIFGIVLMALFLPGLIALYRWAHPQH
ncbi:DUF1707 domain-containing protein [Nocardioides sp. S-58]|uniref:DUF1707 domain-containing protein n=1 Tax=Nocardioides renjunii TaxID=3095075 RepID=A0ABU5K730_9ACTN|nr:DUF1707 domain-containing protein [Nocardioides sp. S-58]MDZ5660778.1 DUF1707 domain-containing protein [Nocardioides sp. S-58]